MVIRKFEQEVRDNPKWLEDNENIIKEWIVNNDIFLQYPSHLRSLGNKLEKYLARYRGINAVIYEEETGKGGGGIPISFFSSIGFVLILVLSRVAEGFFQKIGEDIYNFARDLFKIRRPTAKIGRFAVVFDLQKAQVWYLLPNYLTENDFVSAFTKIKNHISSLQTNEDCQQEILEFIYDSSEGVWKLENHIKKQ